MKKQLPQRADLNHLKGQAKTLLSSLNSGDLDAIKRADVIQDSYRLADAQRILAREYGFASWTKLKYHIVQSADRQKSFFRAVRMGNVMLAKQHLEADKTLLQITDQDSFDAPAINTAASRNDRKMLDLLLDFGADINARSTWWAGGFGALDLADEATSRYLLERGANLTAHAAARLGMVDELRKILKQNPDALHTRGGDGQFPLHFAKTPEIVDILIDAGAEIDARDFDHEGTAAQFLIQNTAVLRQLLKRGARPDIYIATILEDVELLAAIVEADPEALGRTPMMPGNPMIPQAPGMHIYTFNIGIGRPFQIAKRHGKKTALQWLITLSSPKFLFLNACWESDEAEAKRILEANPSLFLTLNSIDKAILPEAAWENKISAVKLMLELGFDVNTVGVHHSSAIDRAAFHGFSKLIEVILPYKPDLSMKNEFGGTPLGACLYGSHNSLRKDGNFPRTAELLIRAGAPLPETASGSSQVIKVLNEHGVPTVS